MPHSKNGGQIHKIAKFLPIFTILSGHIYLHWSPDPDVMYSKAQILYHGKLRENS